MILYVYITLYLLYVAFFETGGIILLNIQIEGKEYNTNEMNANILKKGINYRNFLSAALCNITSK